jgi:hypothetical protein
VRAGSTAAREHPVADLVVTRLLQNPLGQPAPDGQPGDLVRLTDGSATIYLTPREYEQASEAELLYLLARAGFHR